MINHFGDINRVLYCLKPADVSQITVVNKCLTRDRVLTIQKADKVVMDYLLEAGIAREIWQFPTVLVPLDLGSRGDESIVLRPVESQEAMTANFYPMEIAKLDELVKRLSEVPGISGIFYDVTNKPPGTIEWE